jgi:ABC-2 type transport system ATP-binding protein
MITFEQLTKRYGDTIAVDDLTVSVAPGQVTGLLGPNGAGKSTTLRLLLGLDHPTAGTARIAGRPYAALRAPLRTVGAHLDTRSVHPGRTARRHLLALARANRLPARRVDEVIAQVGLHAVAHRRAGTFSQGMAQRLGIAAALLGDPSVLVLDEPTNGLDTNGIRWIRTLLTGFAAEGRTVLLSSHLLAELHQTADHVIVLGRGRLLADCAVAELVATTTTAVHVRMPDLAQRTAFAHLLEADGMDVDAAASGELRVRRGSLERVGDLAHHHGLRLHRLAEQAGTLEDGYLRLVEQASQFSARPAASSDAAAVVHAASGVSDTAAAAGGR